MGSNRIFKTVLLVLLMVTLLSKFESVAVADETKSGSDMIGFYYQNEIPENQVKTGNFFDLLMKPGAKQTLVTTIVNESEHDKVIKVSINNAKTSSSGAIEYGPSDLQNTKTIPYQLTDIVKAPKEIKVPKGGKKKLLLEVTMPDKSYQGVILGGVHLQEKKEATDRSGQANKVAVNNKYGYVYSISLQESEKKVKTELSDNQSFYQAGRGMVSFNNNSSKVVKGMTVEMLLMKKNSDKVLEEIRLEDLKMAPHSIIELPFSFDKYQNGKYRTEVKVKADGKVWEWAHDFKVDKSGASQKEQLLESTTQKGFNWLSLILGLGVFVLATLVIYFVLQKK